MIIGQEMVFSDGSSLRVYDTGAGSADDQVTVFWHHGTPNIGLPPEPLFAAADRLNLRWVSYDRPGYGGSPPVMDRDVASAASYVANIADTLGIERFTVMGHSGGGPHALACAALLPKRVLGMVSVAGLAPFGAEGLDWFGGMHTSGAASLRAAAAGRRAKVDYEALNPPFDSEMFTAADYTALAGPWSWLESVVGPATAAGPGGLIDDDLAYVCPWGFDVAQINVPVLLLHGEQDRVVPSSHSQWLAGRCSVATLRLFPREGHLSVLNVCASALDWLREQADRQ